MLLPVLEFPRFLNFGIAQTAGICLVPEWSCLSAVAQLLLGGKGEAKSTKPRLCFGQEGGISLSTLGSMDGGLETQSPGWDVGKLVCIPGLLKNMPISLDQSLNLPMP